MIRFRKRPTPPISAAVRSVLAEEQNRHTIRMALANGATATPIGAITHIRLPGQNWTQQFPTALVDEVLQSMSKNGH